MIESLSKRHGRMFTELLKDIEERLELVEHSLNQQSILLDTLGDIMKEIENIEH